MVGREEGAGMVVVVGGRGHSMTVPKGAKADWVRGWICAIVMGLVEIEGIILFFSSSG